MTETKKNKNTKRQKKKLRRLPGEFQGTDMNLFVLR